MRAARLFHETPCAGEERQRLLLLTHHFPPSPAIGALRWRRFVGIFAEHGWTADVVTVPPETPATEGLAELPPGTRVWHVDPPSPVALRLEARLHRLYRRVRRSPDASGAAAAPWNQAAPAEIRREIVRREEVAWRLGTGRGWARLWFTARDLSVARAWAQRVAGAALSLADPQRHRLIITSGPPHHWHEAGRRASVESGIPLVVDLRDPWSVADVVHEYFATPVWLSAVAKQERKVVEHASLVVANTDQLRDAMGERHPAARGRMITVMNGYDEEDVPAAERGSAFVVGYAGSIYHGRDPRPLFAGAARVIRDLSLEPADLQLRFIGDDQYGGVPLTALAADAGIEPYVHVGGRTSREEAQRFMAGCQMLVSIPWDDRLTIPAKVFDYARFAAWLLVFAGRTSATARLLEGYDVDVVEPGDVDATSAAIERRFRQFRAGRLPAPLSADARLSRRAQASILLAALHPYGAPSSSARERPGTCPSPTPTPRDEVASKPFLTPQ